MGSTTSSREQRVAAGTRVLLQEKLSAGKISASEYQHMIAVLNRGDRTWSLRAESAGLRMAVAALNAAIVADAALLESLLEFGVTHDRLLQHFFHWQQQAAPGASPAPLTMDDFLASAFAMIAEHDPLGAESSDSGAALSADVEEEGLERTVAAARAVTRFAERLWADVCDVPPLPASPTEAGRSVGDDTRASCGAIDGASPSGGRAKSQRLSQFLLMRKRRAEGEAAAAAAAVAEDGARASAPASEPASASADAAMRTSADSSAEATPPATMPTAAPAGSEKAASGAAPG